MAQRVQVMLVCDLHGDETPAGQTVEFALDGAAYEIDLCEEHAGQLRDALAGFVGVARRAGGRGALSPNGRSGSRRRRRSSGSGDAARIREWARSQGLAVPERGRIPAELAEKYAGAHR
jgi:Lsr2